MGGVEPFKIYSIFISQRTSSGNQVMKQQRNQLEILVGGFNPFETYQLNRIISPGRGEN